MGAVEVLLHALLISAVHQGDWSASSSDLFNIGEGNLGAILQYVLDLQQRESVLQRWEVAETGSRACQMVSVCTL